MAFVAGQRLFFGRHHVGGREHIGGVHEVELTRIGQTVGRLACGQRPLPVQGFPVALGTAGKHGHQQGLVNLVVGLTCPMDLKGRDPAVGVLGTPFRPGKGHGPAGIDHILGRHRFDGAVVPEVFRFDILGPGEAPLDRHVVLFAEFVLGVKLLAVLELAGLGPVPGHFGGQLPGHFRNVTGLAGHAVSVVVGFGALSVGGGAVAGFAGDLGGQIVLDQALAIRGGRPGVDTPGDIVLGGGVAARTVEVLAVHAHMDIQGFGGLDQGGVQIPVFDPVTAAADEMAAAAVLALGSADILGGGLEFGPDFRRDLERIGVTFFGEGRQILDGFVPVDLLAAVAVEAVDAAIERRAPAGVTGKAAGVLVHVGRNAEIVKRLGGFSIFGLFAVGRGLPCPVNRLVKLGGGFRMAGQTGIGDVLAGFEFLLEGRVLAVVRRVPGRLRLGGLLGHGAPGRVVGHRRGGRQGRLHPK